MRRKKLLWQLFPSYLVIIVLALSVVTWFASRSIKQFYLEQKASELEARTLLVINRVQGMLDESYSKELDSLVKELGNISSTRVTIILTSGKVIADSEEDPSVMDNHANRAEVIDAMKNGCGTSTRFSKTLRQNLMYVAVPVKRNDSIIGVVRTSVSVSSIDKALGGVYARIIFCGLAIAGLAAAISLLISLGVSMALARLKRGAELFAAGKLKDRLHVSGTEEIGSLAESLNEMAFQLDRRISEVVRQKNERDAILSSMVEGVIAVDSNEKIINMNLAAAKMLNLDINNAGNKTVCEVIRNDRLIGFITRTLSSPIAVEEDIVIREESGERFLQAHGAVLKDTDGNRSGAVVVLNDITRIRKLENLRQEFVANVSHELRTPITSIKGSIETMQDGAIEKSEDAEKFMGIIARQTDRLGSIIEDLLLLSRIEQETEQKSILLERGNVKGVLETAVENCGQLAGEKKITVTVDCPDNLEAGMNPLLLEQAVTNLIDNAVKYSEPGTAVYVKAADAGGEVRISVRDEGPGIEAEHLPRLFERFYRVDKARSRTLGGTGLGLAIVKHIIMAHNGRVQVDSTPGKGSVFTISLPG
jgi:two-component system phosphate regulon sensor histidine kinase PhoR